jgi:hypothetical protein
MLLSVWDYLVDEFNLYKLIIELHMYEACEIIINILALSPL